MNYLSAQKFFFSLAIVSIALVPSIASAESGSKMLELRANQPDPVGLIDCIGNPTTGGLSPENTFTCTCEGAKHCQWISDKCKVADTPGQWTCEKDHSTPRP